MTALFSNTTGYLNTASGDGALSANTTGTLNTANGSNALAENTTGSGNTATGQDALVGNSTGNGNIALGWSAGSKVTTGSNNIEIGNRGVPGDAKTIRIGKQGTQTTTFISGISGATVPAGVAVIVDTTGHLGTTTSSARFKDAIQPMDKASEAILALKPVTFRYKHELDPAGIPQFGLVAEQVEKVNPDLVVRDDEGKPYSVRYEAVNAMLLNEFLKEHKTVQELKNEISGLTATVKEQAAQIRRVGERIEVSRAAPQLVASDR
jgi:Chaperone of endosialidase